MKVGLVLDPAALEQPEPFEWAGGTFYVRHLTPRKLREIRQKVGLSAWPQDGEVLSDRQHEALSRAVLDWQVADWEGVTDEKGEPVPCDSDTRWLFVETSELFGRLVPRWSENVWAKRQAAARAELGNSKSSSPSAGDATPTEANATTDAAGSETVQSDG